MTQHTDLISQAFELGLGPWLTPLVGKLPHFMAWNELAPVDEDQVREWVEIGFNLGFRTGAASGLIVIDDDQARNNVPEADRFILPPTGLISATPTGGRHGYYRAPTPCPGNSASRIAPYVDVRGEGGQVVFPGSLHPVAKKPYVWVATDEPPGVMPDEVLAKLTDPPRRKGVHIDMTRPVSPSGPGSDRYGAAALVREGARVRNAGEGARNDTLNKAGFSLGQLVGGGVLDRAAVEAELLSAATRAGLSEREATRTIRNGIEAGIGEPRGVPERVESVVATVSPHAPSDAPSDAPSAGGKKSVLIPGIHQIPPDGDFQEQGTDAFTAAVLRSIDPESLYRRGGIPGEIRGSDFVPMKPDRARSVVDRSVRLVVGRESKAPNGSIPGTDPTYTLIFRPCTADLARLVLAGAEAHAGIRELRFIATYPVVVGPEFRPAKPGWDSDSGVFQAFTDSIDPLPIPDARAALEDLVHDFPFQAPSDRTNFFGLLLAPILRPALNGPVPMHLIGSPIERTGKSKLAGIVLGGIIQGQTLAATQIGDKEDERAKRLMAHLIAGKTLLHLDNLSDFLNSPTLASLLTSTVYEDRILGVSQMARCDNGLVVVGTGNNVHATGEVAKRIVPIRLLPASERPQDRSDFRHKDLGAYVVKVRHRALQALLGLIHAWVDAGKPEGAARLGGFEEFARAVGGILTVAGYDGPDALWLSNLDEWQGGADDFSDEVHQLVLAWHETHACESVPAAKVFDLAESLGILDTDRGKNEAGRRASFAKRVLNHITGRVIAGYRAESTGRGNRRLLKLRPLPDAGERKWHN